MTGNLLYAFLLLRRSLFPNSKQYFSKTRNNLCDLNEYKVFSNIWIVEFFLFFFFPPTLSNAHFSLSHHHWCHQSLPAPPWTADFLKYISIQINSYLPFLWPRILKESWGLILQEEFLSYLERNETSSPIHKTFPTSNRTYHLITHSTLILHEFIV